MRCLQCILLIAFAGVASAGTIKTRDGKTFEGALRFETGAIVVTSAGKSHAIKLDDIQSTSFDAPAATRPVPSTRPAAWTQSDVGVVREAGATRFDESRIRLFDHARGFGSARRPDDSFHFAHQRFMGDGAIIVRVRQVEPQRGAKAGLMFRASLAPDAPFVMICRTAEGQTVLQRRAADTSEPEEIAAGERRIAGAAYVKLERSGYAFIASESPDGKSWAVIGQCTIPMDETALTGLAAAGNAPDGRAAESHFDKLQLIPAATNLAAPTIPRGIVTKTGSTLACEILAMDGANITFHHREQQRTLPCASIARCIFVPLFASQEQKLTATTGLLFINGDFVEGEINAIHRDHVKVTSVLFGMRNAQMGREAAACVLRDIVSAPAAFEIKLADRSVLRATAVSLAKDMLTIEEPLLGKIEAATKDVTQIRRN